VKTVVQGQTVAPSPTKVSVSGHFDRGALLLTQTACIASSAKPVSAPSLASLAAHAPPTDLVTLLQRLTI
jgi:hypothetical protein